MRRYPERAIITLAGPDTLAVLERTVTNNVSDWDTGVLRYGALLTPQGKIIADFLALRTGDGVWLDTHEAAAGDLVKRLKMFRLRAKVDIEIDPSLAAIAGDMAEPDPRSPLLGARAYHPPESAEAMDEAEAAQLAIAAGVPEWGRDFTAAAVFPTDVNMDVMDGIDYKKGCFVGQEVASRMKRRGNIRKRTLRLDFETAAPEPGTTVMAGETKLGEITSVSGHHALARLRTDHLAKAMAAGTPLSANEVAATPHIPDWLGAEMAAGRGDG